MNKQSKTLPKQTKKPAKTSKKNLDNQSKKLSKYYHNVKNVGSFSGYRKLADSIKDHSKHVRDWISTQDDYTLHKPVRFSFPRRRVIVTQIGSQWQADLIDVSRISKYNRDHTFLLTCIDVYSKKAWVIPLKNKTGVSIINAFQTISDPLPARLQTDKGTEFINQKVKTWLKKNNVHFFTTENEDIKASVVERFNRSLKSIIWRYFTKNNTLSYLDVLDDVVDTYNRTPHSSLGIAPIDMTSKTLKKAWIRSYSKSPAEYIPPKFKKGDSVRISKARRVFKKGYLPQWSEEIFTVLQVLSTQPPSFRLVDWSGEEIKGTFYNEELQKVKKADNIYRVEKILKEEKNRVFVKWLGYPNSFNSWVNRKDLI